MRTRLGISTRKASGQTESARPAWQIFLIAESLGTAGIVLAGAIALTADRGLVMINATIRLIGMWWAGVGAAWALGWLVWQLVSAIRSEGALEFAYRWAVRVTIAWIVILGLVIARQML